MVEDDIEKVAKIHLKSWKTAYCHFLPADLLHRLTVSEFIETWEKIVATAGRLNRVYCDEQGIQGYVSYATRIEDNHKRGEIIGVYVEPKSWDLGIGRSLIKDALEWLQKQHCEIAYLWTIVENRNAREFYERIGFKSTKTIRTADRYGYAIREMKYINFFNQGGDDERPL